MAAHGRRRRGRVALGTRVLAAAVSLVAVASLAAAFASCAARPRFAVRVEGNHLVNAQGKPIRLLGVNRSGAEYACVQGLGIFPGPTGPGSVAAMASWGIDAVRLPLNEDCWLGINGSPARFSGAHYRAAIRNYVARLNDAGLYVILDLHWNAPGTAPAIGQQPMADLNHAPTFWRSVARTFRSDPAVLFDLYNEPHDISWQCWRDGCLLARGWRTAGMQALVDAVRSAGAHQPVIATGLGWGNDLSAWLRFRPRDPVHQLVAGLHVYNISGCVTVSCWNTDVRPVARRVPVVAAEVGDTRCSGAFLRRFMSWADLAGVSYLGWAWDPAPSGCGDPALIRSWRGQPTRYGRTLRAHLLARR